MYFLCGNKCFNVFQCFILTDCSHSSVERAGAYAGVSLRALPTDSEHRLTGEVLEAAVGEDLARGLVPCAVSVNIAQTRYYPQGEPLALTANNELRKLPSVTSIDK